MASTNKSNGIREILNRGILLSLCLSLLVGSGVLIVWQWGAQVRANDYNASLVREALQRDAADLLTSSMLKNYEAVGFQLKTALASFPIKCAYIELPGQRYALKGNAQACAGLLENGEGAHREEIASGGMTIGPLIYVLDSQALPAGSMIYLVSAFIALVGCVVLTWGVLIKMINDAILRPLSSLTAGLTDGDYSPDLHVTCDEVVSLAEQLRAFRDQVASSAKREAFERVARLVAHNIDTPLLVLEGVDISRLDDENRTLYRSALSDIKGLIGNLRAEAGATKHLEAQTALADGLKTSLDEAPCTAPTAPTTGPLSVEHVMGLVEMAVSEKRLKSRTPYNIGFEPTTAAYRAFVNVQRTELKCILLNIMNNAVEALAGAGRESGQIDVGVVESEGLVRISIKDNGPGIEAAVLPQLGARGLSIGKNGSGSGLGLHHAKLMTTVWGGTLNIDSQLDQGTTVTITLPAAPTPAWFLAEIQLPLNGKVVVLDDDANIGLVWKRRFSSVKFGADSFTSFTQGDDFKALVRAEPLDDIVYLVDYELNGQGQNGIGIIEELGIADNSILVTGRYDDPKVQQKARWLGIRMIPKPLVGLVPIHFEGAPGIRRDKASEIVLEKQSGEISFF